MFDVLKKLGWFFKKYKKQYGIAVLLLMLATVLEIIPPYLIGVIIDYITEGEMTRDLLIQYVAVFLGIIIFSYMLNFFWQYGLFEGSVNLQRLMRRKLMSQFLRMTPTFYEKIAPEILWPGRPMI